ncbi:MAG TPA: SDR family oxidoreductase [Pseudolysinimonas sp.]|nr:SDR family oxidoreductase [Pseudolysinimonas sp.]
MSKRAVVTGASSGIGAATARRLSARGWDVVGVARRADRLAALAADTGIAAIAADITDVDDVARMRREIEAEGPIHALVNNAGGAFDASSVETADPDDWRRMFEVNVIGSQRVIAALLPALRAGARDAGHADILSVTSIAGHEVYENGAGYNAAKFAEHAMMAVLRLELAGEPIRVLEVAPGIVQTSEFALNRFHGDADRAAAVYAGIDDPLTADDVASVIVQSLELPGHVNLDLVTMRPVAQAAQFKVVRRPLVTADAPAEAPAVPSAQAIASAQAIPSVQGQE